eukprot:851577-Alexandrium_andersonii.AAC.1
MDVRVHVGRLHVIDDRSPLGAELGVRQPTHGQVGHPTTRAVLALERCLPDDPTELQAQLAQGRLPLDATAVLAAHAVNDCLVGPQ